MATDENISAYLGKAEQALSSGDKRAAAILVNQVLKSDFTNEHAWQLLYSLAGIDQTFEDFQFEFAARFYPDKIHLLSADVPDWLSNQNGNQPAPSPSSIYAAPPAIRASSRLGQEVGIPVVPQNSPVSQIRSANPAQPINTKRCPVCSKQINLDSIFCCYCGNQIGFDDETTNLVNGNAFSPQSKEPIRDNAQPARPNASNRNDPKPLENLKQKALRDDKYAIPIVITALIFFVLFFAVPFIVWLVGFLGCTAFFLWKMELLPVNLLISIKNVINEKRMPKADPTPSPVYIHAPPPSNVPPSKGFRWGCIWGSIFLVLVAVGVYFAMQPSQDDFCAELDCSQMIIRSTERCNLSSYQRSIGIKSMYILQVDLITPNGGQGRPESIVATRKPNGWSFSEDFWNPDLTCAEFLN